MLDNPGINIDPGSLRVCVGAVLNLKKLAAHGVNKFPPRQGNLFTSLNLLLRIARKIYL
jgi:hypothetical protein